MGEVNPLELERIFIGNHPLLYLAEVALRVVVIYFIALIMTRFLGKRGRSEMTPLEYIVIFSLGSAIGDPMFYPEIPIIWSSMIIATVVILESVISFATNKSTFIRKFIESEPIQIVHEGRVLSKNIKKENFSKSQVMELLRAEGIENTNIVKYAFLEPSGKLSVIKKEEGKYQVGTSTIPENINK